MASSRAARCTKSTSATSSMTGLVSGIMMSPVTPPAAAALLAEAMVSRCSPPGSPIWTQVSISPGMTSWPCRSWISPSDGRSLAAVAPMAAILPSSMMTAPVSSMFCDGSMMRALVRMVRVMTGSPPRASGFPSPPCARRHPSPPGFRSRSADRRRYRRRFPRPGSSDRDA